MTVPDTLRPAPPSAKAAYLALEGNEPLTYSGFKRETKLPESTLDTGLKALRARGVVVVEDDEYRIARARVPAPR